MRNKTFLLLRVLMGWLFFWAFIDKLFGLGFATCRDRATGAVNYLCEVAWIKGGSPTAGFLTNATKGPFGEFFQNLAGNQLVDWLFMIGLAAIGLALIFGVLIKLGGYVGALLMVLMYLAGSIWPANNPFLDQHLIYAVLLVGIAQTHSGWFRWRR